MDIGCIQQTYDLSLRFAIDKPDRRGVYQWQSYDDQGQGSYGCCIHCTNCRSLYNMMEITSKCFLKFISINVLMCTYLNVM